MKNSSEEIFLSSEVSFDSSEVLFVSSEEFFLSSGAIWEIPRGGIRIIGEVGVISEDFLQSV